MIASVVIWVFRSLCVYTFLTLSFAKSFIPSTEPSAIPFSSPSQKSPISVLYTGSPFMSPILKPTSSPTAVENDDTDDILTFDVSQDIGQCNAISYYSDNGAEIAFRHTVASILPEVTYRNVIVTVVEDVPDIFSFSYSLNLQLRQLKSSGITIDYTVKFNIKDIGYENFTHAYSISSNLLTEYIDNGSFTIKLQEMAYKYNSSCFINAIASESHLRISSPFTRYPLLPPTRTPYPTHSPDENRREEMLILIADDAQMSLTIMMLSAVFFFCCCSFCIIKRRMDWVYFRGNTFDDDSLIKETEMRSTAVDEENVVWFNPQSS
eukprot:gene8449-17420_t